MTTFGIDVSHYQAGLDLGEAKKQGFQFVAAKCTEGAFVRDAAYPNFRKQAKDNELLFLAYHFLRADDAITSQADNIERNIGDKAIPLMIDLEPNGGSKPTLRQAAALRSILLKRGIHVTVLYYPHFWWEQSGSPSLHGWALWQANYGANQTGFASVIYPGDISDRWATQGGVKPSILQFGSRGQVTGWKDDVDVDAFIGDRAALVRTGMFHEYKKPIPVDPAVKAALAENQQYQLALSKVTDRRWTKVRRWNFMRSLRAQAKTLTKWTVKK